MIHPPNQDESQIRLQGNPNDSSFWRDALNPADMVEADVIALRTAGFDDGQILEINQVTAYFSYANRTVLGLGCSTDGDDLGLSPGNSEDPDDWGHR